MFRRILLLTVTFVPCAVSAQSTFRVSLGRPNDAGTSAKDPSVSVAAASSPSIEVSKTASVNGQNVCGVIRIKNTGAQLVTINSIVDFLEVHFSRETPPAGLPLGSTPGWFKVANVPIAVPGPVAPRATVTIDYCFSLCLATDAPGANSMRNVVAVTVSNASGGVKTVTTRSVSFPPPILDCQACCLPEGSCTDTVLAACGSTGGLARGTGTDCATTECTQACCLGDGSCEDESLSACEGDGGEALGLGTTCSNTTCRGACCVADLGCVFNQTFARCRDELQGRYLGNDTNCESAFAACPTGACCDLFGFGGCSEGIAGAFLNEPGCENSGGAYLGDGSTCANTTCRGACCVADLGCVFNQTFTRCTDELQGTYLGNDTTCESEFAACPTGACCGGSLAICVEGIAGANLNQGGCESTGGTYLGDGTTCTSTSCCISLFGSCTGDSDCCSGLVCTGGLCDRLIGP